MEILDEEEEDGSFTCEDCSYQTISRDQLIEHKEKTHTHNFQIFKCDMCKIDSRSQKEVNVHNKNKHNKSFKPCRNFPSNRCECDTECAFYHVTLNQGEHIC